MAILQCLNDQQISSGVFVYTWVKEFLGNRETRHLLLLLVS
jgi:hypothetical protein